MTPSNTNVYMQVQDSKGKMTWGILESALTGLQLAALNYGPTSPMVFQINDGEWGEVGIGVIGIEVGDDPNNQTCYYEITPSGSKNCNDVQEKKVIN